jgi:GT2 family glycosyltransferase/glycosyltransferase involved in cell wall biosynthesis
MAVTRYRFHLDPLRREMLPSGRVRIEARGWFGVEGSGDPARLAVVLGDRRIACCPNPYPEAIKLGLSAEAGFSVSFETGPGWKWLKWVALDYPIKGKVLARRLIRINQVPSPAHAPAGVLSDGLPVQSRDSGFAYERLLLAPRPVTVIVPVYNGLPYLERCLQALLRHTPGDGVRFLVINDASPDPAIKAFCDKGVNDARVGFIHQPENQGFTRTVNNGIRLADEDDVVLLNSDTQVGPGWLPRLQRTAYHDPFTATATPLSNCAGPFSISEPHHDTPLTVEDTTRRIARNFCLNDPVIATGHGFCLYIRRDALREVGLLDEEAFPRGYGEENDFCLRATRLGWRHRLAARVWVNHRGEASFGTEKPPLLKRAETILADRYPEYANQLQAMSESPAFNTVIRSQEEGLMHQRERSTRPRILMVISGNEGGTFHTNNDLMTALEAQVEPYLFGCDGMHMRLSQWQGGRATLLAERILDQPVRPLAAEDQLYLSTVDQWLECYAFELVHIRHLGYHSLELIRLLNRWRLPLVYSFHDYHALCPSLKLLDDQQRYCGGDCTDGPGDCQAELYPEGSLPALKHQWVTVWREAYKRALADCQGYVTTSQYARNLLLKALDLPEDRPFAVIPHGRDFNFQSLASPYRAGEPIRVLVLGNMTVAKGLDRLRAVKALDPDNQLQLHFLGRAPEDFPPEWGVFHGSYSRDALAEKIATIKPHYAVIFSIWPETHCHTLTECWAYGLPVLAFDCGAVGERMREHEAGLLLPLTISPAELLEAMITWPKNHMVSKENLMAVKVWQNQAASRETVARMADTYGRFYGQVVPGLITHINRLV